MRPGEFIADRLGKYMIYILLEITLGALLLATGTQPGVLLLVLSATVLAAALMQTAEYLRIAKTYGLHVSGGSDFHGESKPDHLLAAWELELDWLL